MDSTDPSRGEVWLVAFGASRRDEPGRHRPAIVVSSERVLAGLPGEPVIVVPLSSSAPGSPLRPPIAPGQGVERQSQAICGAVRGVARSRLVRRLGSLEAASLAEVDRALVAVLGLATEREREPRSPSRSTQ